MRLSKQNCSNCKYARPSSFPDKDGKNWLSCRFTPPIPYADEKTTDYKNFRIVPEDFWCGKWEEYFD
jgi:hypothetical protein